MQITKIVNNNIVISEDKNHKEVVLMGKGLGFQKHKGDEIKSSQIEKTYVMKDHGMTQRFQEMLTDIPIERVKICNKIIQYAKDTLQKNINDNIYVSLTDHINFAIERVEMGVPFQNPLFMGDQEVLLSGISDRESSDRYDRERTEGYTSTG